MRADLEVSIPWVRSRRLWVVKDPAALTYWHFSEEEYSVLSLLDGKRSSDDVCAVFEQSFAPRKLRGDRLRRFLGQLHRQGLVIAEHAGQGEQLLARQRKQGVALFWQKLQSGLAVRLGSLNPQAFLARILPWCGWIFSPWCFFVWLVGVFASLIWCLVHFDALQLKLAEVPAWLAGENLPWLIVALVLVRGLHELGHALALTRLEGKCPELGVQLLVLAPCLYCNVSDAWMIPGKWRRILISAAGMYVELAIAACSLFVWWHTEPGVLNSLSLNLLCVCSVGTLLYNANPLVRSDGYYILSDLTETPNLDARSRTALARIAARWLLGIRLPSAGVNDDANEPWLAVYGAVALAFRWMAIGFIYYALLVMARPYHAEILVNLYMGWAAIGPLTRGLSAARSYFQEASMKRELHPWRLAAGVAGAGLVIALMAWVPVPYRVHAPVVLDYDDADRVYVTVAGTLVESATPGQDVAIGQPVARLENLEVSRQRLHLEGEHNRQALEVRLLETRQSGDLEAAVRLPAAREALADLAEQLAHAQAQEERLTLRAPAAGKVLSPPRKPAAPLQEELQLASWSGTPLEMVNRGCYLEAGTLVCQVGNEKQLTAIALVEQSEVEFVHPGEKVQITLSELPGGLLRGKVGKIARIAADEKLQDLPETLKLPMKMEQGGNASLLQTYYRVQIELQPSEEVLLAGAPGRCRIHAAWQPLGERLWRLAARTFQSADSTP